MKEKGDSSQNFLPFPRCKKGNFNRNCVCIQFRFEKCQKGARNFARLFVWRTKNYFSISNHFFGLIQNNFAFTLCKNYRFNVFLQQLLLLFYSLRPKNWPIFCRLSFFCKNFKKIHSLGENIYHRRLKIKMSSFDR